MRYKCLLLTVSVSISVIQKLLGMVLLNEILNAISFTVLLGSSELRMLTPNLFLQISVPVLARVSHLMALSCSIQPSCLPPFFGSDTLQGRKKGLIYHGNGDVNHLLQNSEVLL